MHGEPAPQAPSALISVRGLTWAPPGGAPVLRDLELDLSAGERLSLSGRSGSGKSTLLRCVVLLEAPAGGQVWWRGQALGPANVRPFRRQVRLVDQQPAAIANTVGEDLDFARALAGSGGMDEREQRDLLARLGLKDLDMTRPFARCSVGERQRIAIVRALTDRPTVLLLDEPTASLDPERVLAAEGVFLDYLSDDQERAAVWVSHDPSQQDRIGGRVAKLHHGQIEAQ
jgi:putative ABC transport system ATP-binding protein